MPKVPVVDGEPDRRRIRLGLAFLAAVVVVAVSMAFVVQAAIGKAVMIGIALFTVARLFSLARAVRRESV